MSDSDDTDVLLLIPPDFFFVAPSPSPASSPLSLSPLYPIYHPLFQQDKPLLTEQQARESLKELTSQLRLIDKRLSIVESQRSGSMDGENSNTWYDLESYTGGNCSYQPHTYADRSIDWQSMSVQELLQATARDSKSLDLQQNRLMTQSWGPSNKEYSMSSNQHYKVLPTGRESTCQSKERYDSSDDEEKSRGRRAASLPVTPSSRHPHYNTPTKQFHHKPPPGSQKDAEKLSLGAAIATERTSDITERNISRAGGKEAPMERKEAIGAEVGQNNMPHKAGPTAGMDEFSEKEESRTARGPEKKSERTEQNATGGEQMRVDNQKALHGVDDALNFNLNNSDGTLGVSALIPSLSSVGLNASFVNPASLDMTKETSGSVDGGNGGGITLTQVEKLLRDMQKTQAEMERSMRRGMEHLERKEKDVGRPQIVKTRPGVEGQDELEGSLPQEKKIAQVSDIEKKRLESGEDKISHGNESKRDGWVNEGVVQGSQWKSSMPPVSIVVEETSTTGKNHSNEGGCDLFQEIEDRLFPERGRIEGQSMYRSKSDESLSGKYGRSGGDNNAHKYLGTESGDDSFVSSGHITTSRITRLGDTLGSVPDLGLGVREMFDKSGKLQDVVKEPPFVKKNISLLGCANPRSAEVDAVVMVTEDDSVAESRPTKSKITIEKIKFDDSQLSAKEEDTAAWLRRQPNKEYKDTTHFHVDESHSNLKSSHFHSPARAKEVIYYSPQKESLTPQYSQSQRNGSNSDARRQLHWNAETRHMDHPPVGMAGSSLDVINSTLRPPMREGNENQSIVIRDRNKEDIGAESRTQRSQKHSLPAMGSVIVVGGDGYRKVWRDERESTSLEREKLRRQDENVRFSDNRRDVGRKAMQIGREVDKVDQRVRHKDGREGGIAKEGDNEQISQNDDVGHGKHARFRDSGYGDGARSLFRGPPPTDGCRLFSGSDVWVPPLTADMAEAAIAPEGALVLRRKLEEERFRREHCERVIEEVGRRALEAHERLAVSEGMSKAKDVALGKFHNAWEEAVCGWKREGEARKALEEEVERYRERVKAEITYRDKRLKQLEGEVVSLGDEGCSLREELRKRQRENAEITARLSAMLEVATKEVTNCRKESENASLREVRAQEDASKARDAAKEAKKKSEEAVKRADSLESEKVMMKQELETLQGKLRDFTSRISTLETRLADAEVTLDKAHQNEKSSCEALVLAQQEWENERIKLKEFYQSQVEELVRMKVNEFQGQLDAVESSLRKEAQLREEEAKRLGEERLRLLNEKNTQEVNLLEQKHEEELALWSLRLKRAMNEVDNLKEQVSKHNAQKSQLAKSLHALMQAQLKEGLRLIASGGHVDQELIQSPPKRIQKPTLESSWRDVMASLNIPENTEFLPEREQPKKEIDYAKEKRFQSKGKTDKDLPLSGSNKISQVSNNDLKKYIHMLLGQEPGKPIGVADVSSDSEEDCEMRMLESKYKQALTKEGMKPIGAIDNHKIGMRERKRSRRLKTKVAEKEDACKLSRDVPIASWEPMALRLEQPTSMGNVFESYPNEQENRRDRKPPWK